MTTPIDERVEPPEPKLTARLDKMEIIQAQLTQVLTRVGEGFAKSEERFDKQDGTLERVVDEGIKTNVRLDRVETRLTGAEARVEALEGRAGNTSLRVQGASQVDLEQAAQLAQERAAREALAVEVKALSESQSIQTAIIRETANDVRKFLATPTVKIVGGILFGIFSTWLAKHYGIELPK